MPRHTGKAWTAQQLDTRYQSSFGRAAGYLPKNRAALDAWLEGFSRDVHEKRARNTIVRRRSVDDLARLIERDGIIRMYVSLMIDDANEQHPDAKHRVNDVPDLLDHLDCIVTSTPEYHPKGDPDRNFFPLSSLFVYMMMTEPGYAVFRDQGFNKALLGILREWCAHLDSPDSQDVINRADGWLSPAAWKELELDQFRIDSTPHGGFPSYNAFFHRELKDDKQRPIDTNEHVVVSANDGKVVRIRRNVQRTDEFWAKGQRYSLSDMLDGSDLTDSFIGGDVFQSFLSGGDYHRWHAPVTGTVLSARVVEALMFTELEGVDEPNAGTQSQVYGASVNTRGLVFIECPAPIGIVCVMPMGMTEISSVTLTVRPGDHVTKGQQLGYFSYGGSSLCLIFQKGAIGEFCVPDNPGSMEDGAPIKVNAKIAVTAGHKCAER
ncbi:phosphatidylserine decarboxylase family protein [Streptomyces sp. UNOB3_S3]|uniref:phosphatidylserine decarboxylase family protein n=1 Tax=Streptomyces sp. UNOB3_S3 TaxID=2871682 RepID=UPI001E400B51|nr:phosphatidylserine decarboxylase family protein [Streptomyces sp. UNOB3_S3]MCC3775952.1 phosphatidylserine decarboxylase family protein [Streptomyces sp. UNOB3_S3]